MFPLLLSYPAIPLFTPDLSGDLIGNLDANVGPGRDDFPNHFSVEIEQFISLPSKFSTTISMCTIFLAWGKRFSPSPFKKGRSHSG